MLLKGLVLLVVITLVTSYDDDKIKDLASVLVQEELSELSDSSERHTSQRAQRVLDRHGMKASDFLADSDVVQGFFNIFTSGGKKKTFTTANFVEQLACYQGRDEPFWADALWANSKFNNYGCYCGGGFQNSPAVDATDRCCKAHDHCYTRAQHKYGVKFGCHTYTTLYTQACCKEERITKCMDEGPSAGRDLCECDQAAAKCLAQPSALKTYNKGNKNLRSSSRCGRNGPAMSFLDQIKTCKHVGTPIKTFKTYIKSQGECPKKKKTYGTW